MSKSVLSIDTPEKGCSTCIIGHIFMDGDVFCPIEGIIISRKEAESIPDWCPLKPLPKYKSMEKPWEYEYGKMHGWNACLREIAETSEENKQRK